MKNKSISPHIATRVIKAPAALGSLRFLILNEHRRSTRGLPIIERTPDTSMYTTIFLKNQRARINSTITPTISIFLNVAFIARFIHTNLK